MSTLRDIVYFTLLLALYIFICALLGMEAYAYKVKMVSVETEVPVPAEGRKNQGSIRWHSTRACYSEGRR